METETWQENPRVSGMIDSLKGFTQQTPPRTVPPDVYRRARSPIALFLAIIESLSALVLALSFALGVVNAIPVAFVFAIVLFPTLVVALGALYSLAVTRRLLAEGKLYEGKVVAVKPIPARINARTFFAVTLEFEGPGGAKTKAKDTVDNFASEYFVNARDKDEQVELLYAPNMMGKALLPMKMAIGNRYD